MMILLHAFIKKQQKTPKPDLDLAKDRLKQLKFRHTRPRADRNFPDGEH
jgi:phage-related protein